MRVAVYHSNADIRIEEWPAPTPGPGEILVRVHASGICGSDVMEWYRVPKAPLVLGHEIAGEIVKVGGGAQGLARGQRVVVSHHVPCGQCRLCMSGHETACDTLHLTNVDPGGFAEYVRVPAPQTAAGVLALPEHMSYEEGTFVEPLACVVRAQERALSCGGRRPDVSDVSVLVLGAGISGLLHIRLALANGARRLFATDVSDYRLDAARRSGATDAWAAQGLSPTAVADRLREANDGRLADIIFLCTAARSAIDQGMACLEPGGVFVFFAPPPPDSDIPLPMLDLWRKDGTVATSYGAAPHDLRRALNLIAGGRVRVDDLITHRLPLERTNEGFSLVAKADKSIKVIIEPAG